MRTSWIWWDGEGAFFVYAFSFGVLENNVLPFC